ncbi:NADH dehydrogenase [Bacillus cereus]|uniref:NADH dehydrogenase n=1 Tax=Bacillus cereus TaxID=1396 RepID=UPI0008188523|nr:NADH dehydrogenase [Bacillus cereus]
MFTALMFLFLLVSILSVIALIIGLIKPGKVVRFGNTKTRGRVILIFLPVLFISFILASAFASKSITPEERVAIDKKRAEEKVLKENQEKEKIEKEKKAKEQEKKAQEKEEQEKAKQANEEKKAAEEKRKQEEAQQKAEKEAKEKAEAEEKEKQQKEKKESTPDKEKQLPATQSNKISVKAGLGDTEENFVKEYGSNKGSASIARFANDYIIAMFLEGRANNITLQFSQSGKQSRSLSDVMTEVKNILPVDAIEKERYTDAQDPEREIITFTSEILKNSVPETAFLGDESGTCMAIIRKGLNEEYISAVIALGTSNP